MSKSCPAKSKSVKVHGGIYDWSQSTQGWILSAFFYGYIVTHVPGGFLSDKYGGKHVFSAGIAISGVLSLLTPLAVEMGGSTGLLILRLVVGSCQGFLFPSATTLLAKWVPKRERSTLGSLVLIGPQIGSILATVVSGYLIGLLNSWKIPFYFWGVVALAWYLIFLLVCFSEPVEHPFISDKEKDMLLQEIGVTPKFKIPWIKLIFDPGCLALMAGQMGHGLLFFLIAVNLPKYMKDVLKFNIKENGLLNAIPYLALWLCGTVSGFISDYLINKGKVSIIFIRKLYTTIASVGPSIFLVAAGYMGCNRDAATVMFILCMFTMGPFYPGLRVNALDITKNFAGIVTAFVNAFGSVAYAPIPPLIGVIARDNTYQQWTYIFWFIFIMATITNIIYLIWASGERAEWDKVE